MIQLSEDQEIAFEKISKWLGGEKIKEQKKKDLLTFAGWAGTGKSTIVSEISKRFDSSLRFAFCALSGRAASVLGTKLRERDVDLEKHYCGTIHRLIYRPIQDDKGQIVHWSRNKDLDYDFIILDEASMISEYIYRDLASYKIPILAVGDHGQLPPIEGKLALMKSPDIKLEKIHRQAEGNPIINLSMQIRNGVPLNKISQDYKKNEHVKFISKWEYKKLLENMYSGSQSPSDLLDKVVLCYMNYTRTKLNQTIRKIIYKSDNVEPKGNDVVVCLRNNTKHRVVPIYNGYRGFIKDQPKEVDDDFVSCNLNFPFEGFDTYEPYILKHQFGQSKTFSSFDELEEFGMQVMSWEEAGLLFDYGYAMTTHKMQGSQAQNVVIYNERPQPVSDEDYKRWLYTSVTRSTDKVTIIL